jgi:hypothetical protein
MTVKKDSHELAWLPGVAVFRRVPCAAWSLVRGCRHRRCTLLSALIRHWDLVKSSLDSFAAKVAVAIVAAAALFFSPWIANQVLSEVTLLRPSAFPAAYSAFQYIATLVLWGMLAYLALIAVAIFNVQQIFSGAASKIKREWYVRTEILASLGRLAGLAVLLPYLALCSCARRTMIRAACSRASSLRRASWRMAGNRCGFPPLVPTSRRIAKDLRRKRTSI